MKRLGWPSVLRVDRYIMAILAMVALASVLPVHGGAAEAVGLATKAAIGLLFFLYGGRLSRQAVVAGLTHWRLQLTVLASTFVLFPLLSWGLSLAFRAWLGPELAFGLLFLAFLPSTVQSSIAFTSIARGNIPAAICAASLSNLAGVVITPAMVALIASRHGTGFSSGTLKAILMQLLAPFALGQALRPLTAGWLERNRRILGLVDRGAILLVVYSAFSAGMVAGIWHQVDLTRLGLLIAICALLLALMLAANTYLSRRLGFSTEDEVTVVFCGSKKSLASGLPMANILFTAHSVGLIVLPLMLFHQIQLMVCAHIARRYARRE